MTGFTSCWKICTIQDADHCNQGPAPISLRSWCVLKTVWVVDMSNTYVSAPWNSNWPKACNYSRKWNIITHKHTDTRTHTHTHTTIPPPLKLPRSIQAQCLGRSVSSNSSLMGMGSDLALTSWPISITPLLVCILPFPSSTVWSIFKCIQISLHHICMWNWGTWFGIWWQVVCMLISMRWTRRHGGHVWYCKWGGKGHQSWSWKGDLS